MLSISKSPCTNFMIFPCSNNILVLTEVLKNISLTVKTHVWGWGGEKEMLSFIF